jgi:thymidylate synthase (FAD)
MRIIKPLVIIEDTIDEKHFMKKIEYFTRKCYKSEGKMTEDSWKTFPRDKFQNRNHTGIAEHRYLSVTFITDRGVSHEGVRHRMASYLQESTRYVDYSKRGHTFILPPWVEKDETGESQWFTFKEGCEKSEETYNFWRKCCGWDAQQARYWLPNGTKTEYVATLNLGSWHNFFKKRVAKAAHPQMRQVAIPLLRVFQKSLPQFFDNIEIPEFIGEEAKVVFNPYYDQIEFEEVN